MTIVSIATALIVGCTLGGAAALTTQGRRSVPAWVLVSVGVAAALAGAMLGRLAGLDGSRLRFAELLAQATAAGLAVTGAVAPSRRGAANRQCAQALAQTRAGHGDADQQTGNGDGVTT